MVMSIKQKIDSWDGKSVNDLEAIYSSYSEDGFFVKNIIELAKNEAQQKGVTWLLKRHLENGNKIEANEISVIYVNLPELVYWEAKLNILQCIHFMPIAESETKQVEIFLRNCLTETNKFVRAWAYNGFYEISVQYPEYKKETKQFFEMAMRDEVPSVKARIRNIMKNGF